MPYLFPLLLLLGGFFSSCNQDDFSADPKYILSFSQDTLSFDTVFTTLGSATSRVMIYNPHDKALKVSHIRLAGASSSSFRLNVDGAINTNSQFADIEINAHDSMFIFVALTVDPLNANSPIFIEDSIEFLTNGVKQSLKLQAYGQDMIPLNNVLVTSDSTLTAEKPFIVTGYLAVDSAKTLTLAAGCKLYFHNNARMLIFGNLKAEGTAAKPILMRGDRLDKLQFETPVPFNDVSGQWDGVYFYWSGGQHVLRHVNMNSGYVGLYFANGDKNQLPSMEISNCRIHNFLLYGLVVSNANVKVTNTEISNSSNYTVYLNGGKHEFIHSTIVNYFNNSDAQPTTRERMPAVMIMDYNRISPMQSIFKNCVIAGSYDNEFSLATRFPVDYTGSFQSSYIKRSKFTETPQFTNIRWSAPNDSLFQSIDYDIEKKVRFNFEPNSISPIRGIADPAIANEYPLDLNGKSRIADGTPDAGAYEWVE